MNPVRVLSCYGLEERHARATVCPPFLISLTLPRLHHDKSPTTLASLALQAQAGRGYKVLNSLVSFETLLKMASFDGAVGVSGQQRLQRQIEELSEIGSIKKT